MASIGLRVLIVWLYNNNGWSVLIAILFHSMINVSNFLFPNNGRYYDPFFASIVIFIVVAGVVLVWKPHTLAYKLQTT